MNDYVFLVTQVKLHYRKISKGNRALGSLFNGIAIVVIGLILYQAGFVIANILGADARLSLPIKSPYLLISTFLLIDITLKYFFKRTDFSFLTLTRLPTVKKQIRIYYLLSEMLSFWNVYAIVLLLPVLLETVYAGMGMSMFVISLAILYALQLLCSLLVVPLTMMKVSLSLILLGVISLSNFVFYLALHYGSALSHFIGSLYFVMLLYAVFTCSKHTINQPLDQGAFAVKKARHLRKLTTANPMLNYLLFGLKMLWRSPVLRRQLICYMVLSIVYIYIYNTRALLGTSAIGRLAVMSFLFSAYPLLMGHFYIAAESAFFEKLIQMPGFFNYLWSKYCLSLCFMSGSFIFFLVFAKNSIFVEAVVIFLYCMGPISLGSFTAICFANTRLNLYGKMFEIYDLGLSLQAWVVMFAYLLGLLVVLLIQLTVPGNAVLIFMAIAGLSCLIFAKRWLKFLVYKFLKDKYKKVDLFRN